MRKGLLKTIYVLFFFAVGGAVLAFNIQNQFASSPDFIKSSLAEADIYQRLVHINAKDLEEIIAPESRDADSQISSATLQQLIQKVSPETLQSTVESGLNLYYDAYLNDKSEVSIDLRKIKADVVAEQPAEISAELNKSVPDTYTLKIAQEKNKTVKLLSNKNAKYISLAFLALLFVVGILLAEGWQGKVKSLATFLLIAGIETIVIWYILTILPVSSISQLSDTNISQYLLTILEDFAAVVLSRFAQIFRAQGFVLAGIGILVLCAWFFISRQKSPEQRGKTEPESAAKPTAIDKQEKV